MTESCPFCEKQGLAILPVRYGIAPSKQFPGHKFREAPPDPIPYLGAPEVAIPESTETMYTGRSLRPGYLYVYYESESRWEAYVVDDQACLSAVPLDGGSSARFHESCARDAQKVANASLLTIQDAETAGKIWIGFSDVRWTQAVRDGIAGLSDGNREKVMQLLDVTTWYNKGNPAPLQPGSFQLMNVDLFVADYAMPLTDYAISLSWTPYHYIDRDPAKAALALKRESERLQESKGLVLRVKDPVAVAQELSSLIDTRYKFATRDYARQTQLDSDLTLLEHKVRQDARQQLYEERREKQYNDAYYEMKITRGYQWSGTIPDRVLVKHWKDISAAEYKDAADKLWHQYVTEYDHDARHDYKVAYQAVTEACDKKYVKPLSEVHSQWMKSVEMHQMFEHHFDAQDINSGMAFTALVTACIAGTGGYVPCMQLYNQWLSDGFTKGGNPIMSTLVFNHPDLQAAVEEAGQGDALKHAAIWGKLFGTYKTTMSGLKLSGDSTYTMVAKSSTLNVMIAELGPTLSKNLHSTASGRAGQSAKQLVAALGMNAGMPARWVEVTGSYEEVFEEVFKTLSRLQPKDAGMNAGQLKQAAAQRMSVLAAELEVSGLTLDEKVRAWTLVFDDANADPDALAALPEETRAKLAAEHLKLFAPAGGEYTHINLPASSGIGRTFRLIKSPTVLGPLSLLFASMGLSAMQEHFNNALQDEYLGSLAMLRAAQIGIIGGSFDAIVGVVHAAQMGRSIPYLSPVADALAGRFLTFATVGGAAAGALAGWIMAVVDFRKFVNVALERDFGLAGLYFLKTGLEIGVAYSLTATAINMAYGTAIVVGLAGLWFIAAIIAIIVLMIAISLLSDPATVNWLENTLWGEDNSYDSAHVEHADFRKALRENGL